MESCNVAELLTVSCIYTSMQEALLLHSQSVTIMRVTILSTCALSARYRNAYQIHCYQYLANCNGADHAVMEFHHFPQESEILQSTCIGKSIRTRGLCACCIIAPMRPSCRGGVSITAWDRCMELFIERETFSSLHYYAHLII